MPSAAVTGIMAFCENEVSLAVVQTVPHDLPLIIPACTKICVILISCA
jgi:hypothetical protein